MNKNLNKKMIILVLVAAMLFVFSACDGTEMSTDTTEEATQADTTDESSDEATEESTQEEETTETEYDIDEGVLEDMKVDPSELTERELELLESVNDVDLMDFTLPDFDGTEHTLSDYVGQIIILNFWAVGCPPCVSEMPDFSEVAEQDGVVLITVAQNGILSNEKEASYDFIKDYNTVALWDENVSTMDIYPSQYYPHTYIIDRSGVIRFVINSASYDFLSELVAFCDEVLN